MGITLKNIKVSPKVWIKDYAAPVAIARIKQDINRWRMAIREAESPTNPQRYLMQQMYNDVVLNGHVAACINRRVNNVLRKGIQVCDDVDNCDESLTKIYSQKFMHDIIRFIIEADMFGYNLIQCGDMVDYKFEELYFIRRSNVNPELRIVTNSAYALEGISIDDEKYAKNLIWITTPNEVGQYANWGKCGNGLLYKIAPYEIWYRQAMTLWNEYQQLFGMPIRVGKTDTRDESMRSQMSEMLANMGAAAWAVVDLEDSIEFAKGMSSTGSNEVYLSMVDKVEGIISKLILGHKDAIDSIPGKLGNSNGETSPAQLAMREIEAFDCQRIEHEIQFNILPKLIGMGFPELPKGYKISFVNSYEKMEARKNEDENNKITSDVVKTLADSGLDVDPVWFTERTGIPVTRSLPPEPVIGSNKKIAETLQNKLDYYYNHDGCDHD